MSPQVYKYIKNLPTQKFSPGRSFNNVECVISEDDLEFVYSYFLGNLMLFSYKDKIAQGQPVYLGRFDFNYEQLILGPPIDQITLDLLSRGREFFASLDNTGKAERNTT